jgi:hypothetical protein
MIAPMEIDTTATFYGIRVDSTGNMKIDVINDDTMPVVLPQQDAIDPNDYKGYFWDPKTIQYEFASNGHLRMKVL